MRTTLDLDKLLLDRGGHQGPDDGFCVMELTSYLAKEPWGDHPECVSPVIASFLRSWNDGLDDATRQRLKPYAAKVMGTNTGEADEETRAWMVTDWLVRVHMPAWLERAGMKERADEIRNLPPLTSTEVAVAVQATLEKARDAAWAAAWAAARDAAWAAAWAAARAAARDAARAAARAAARDAARDAARAAAWDAAWDAARDAARAAARDAARDAARAAAYEKVREVLQPTVVELQQSAFELLDRLIAVSTRTPELVS